MNLNEDLNQFFRNPRPSLIKVIRNLFSVFVGFSYEVCFFIRGELSWNIWKRGVHISVFKNFMTIFPFCFVLPQKKQKNLIPYLMMKEKMGVHMSAFKKLMRFFPFCFAPKQKNKNFEYNNPLCVFFFSLLWINHKKVMHHQQLVWGRGLEVVKVWLPQIFPRY